MHLLSLSLICMRRLLDFPSLPIVNESLLTYNIDFVVVFGLMSFLLWSPPLPVAPIGHFFIDYFLCVRAQVNLFVFGIAQEKF